MDPHLAANPIESEAQIVRAAMDRYRVAADFDRPFKDQALVAWMNYHNILPQNWPFWSTHFEPETQTAVTETVERIMAGLFPKDRYFDLIAQQEQGALRTEMTREWLAATLRRAKYKLTKYRQMQEAVCNGNGVEFHFVQPRVITDRQRQPVTDEWGIMHGYEEQVSSRMEFWPRSKIISRFDCYPATTGSAIQEMPYFQHRELVPLESLRQAQGSAWRNVDKLTGFLAVDYGSGNAALEDQDLAYDLYERLRSIGLNVKEGLTSVKGAGAVEYVELLYESIAPPTDEGCHWWRVIGNRSVLLRDEEFPFWHKRKPYSEIKNLEHSANLWQGIGLPELIAPLQLKLNLRSNQASDAIVQHNRPSMLVNLSKTVDGDMTQFDHWPDRKINVHDTEGVVEILNRPTVTADLFGDLDLTRASIQRITKLFDATRNQAGSRTGIGEAAKTATGLQLITSMMSSALSFKMLLAEETGIVDGLEIYLALTQQVLTRDQKVRIEDPTNPVWSEAGVEEYLTVSPADVQGQYQIVCVGASQTPDSPELLALWDTWIKEGFQVPEIADKLKPLDAWLFKGEALKIPTPRRFLMNAKEYQAKQQEAQQPRPNPEVVASMAYRDMPPDLQRQVEAAAGFAPSTVGGVSPVEKSLLDAAAKRHTATMSAAAKATGPEPSEEPEEAGIIGQ